MKAILSSLGAVLVYGWLTGAAQAGNPPPYYHNPYLGYHFPSYPCPRPAPDMCGPGYYAVNACGMVYGPNYCVYPPFPPVGTVPPNLGQQNGGSRPFVPHPFARGPRDYFMLDQ